MASPDTKTIALSERAYNLLAAKKREGESFNDVVERLAGDRPLLDMVGTGSADDEFEHAVTDARESIDRSTDRYAGGFDATEPDSTTDR
jgi:predicted CopG family antitoxin